MEKKIIIRAAKRSDCESLKKMSQELATFEKVPGGSKLDVEVWERDGFCEHPHFYCFVAEIDGELAGFLTYRYAYSTWVGQSMYIDGLFVQPTFRNKGIGGKLFDAVAKKAADENCARIDLLVLNTNPAAEFYKHKGAVDVTESENWHVFRISDDVLKKFYTNSNNI